ncbi:MAG: hypothetical protein IH851_01615 [Armatimonadetes bacterium]|nr:hypothetical protein [Armatimonadota bacterium]
MPEARFAWQGFSLPLSDEWRPAILSGGHREGYVRLEGEREDAIQVRWKAGRAPRQLNQRVLKYFGNLEGAARRRKLEFKGELDPNDDGSVEFRWRAGLKGYGRMWHDAGTNRVMLFERSGRAKDSFKQEARALWEALETFGSGLWPWSVVGLSVRVPAHYRLESWKLLSGRTTLAFRGRGAKVAADRWCFASQLIARHGLTDWARAATGLSELVEERDGAVRLSGRPGLLSRARRWEVVALVRHDPARNHLIVLHSEHAPGLGPEWEWLS